MSIHTDSAAVVDCKTAFAHFFCKRVRLGTSSPEDVRIFYQWEVFHKDNVLCE